MWYFKILIFLFSFSAIGQNYYYVAGKTIDEVIDYGPELLTNGGFDSDISGWDFHPATLVWNAGIAEFDATSTGHRVMQLVTVDPETEYLFSFQAKRGTISATKYSVFRVNSPNGNIIAPTTYTVGTSVFETVNVLFTTPAGCTSINVYVIRDSGETGTAFFDNASLKKVL